MDEVTSTLIHQQPSRARCGVAALSGGVKAVGGHRLATLQTPKKRTHSAQCIHTCSQTVPYGSLRSILLPLELWVTEGGRCTCLSIYPYLDMLPFIINFIRYYQALWLKGNRGGRCLHMLLPQPPAAPTHLAWLSTKVCTGRAYNRGDHHRVTPSSPLSGCGTSLSSVPPHLASPSN